jgi:hypothetical protein
MAVGGGGRVGEEMPMGRTRGGGFHSLRCGPSN